MAKKQVKLYFEQSFIEEASNAAVRYGRRSGNAVMEELLTKFFPLWKQVEEEKLQTITKEYQEKETVKPPLRKIK